MNEQHARVDTAGLVAIRLRRLTVAESRLRDTTSGTTAPFEAHGSGAVRVDWFTTGGGISTT